MKSLIAFSHVLLDELGEWCGVCAPRDHKTITRRVEHEGVSFLTITLPAFAKDFERGLAQGGLADDLFLGFRQGPGGLPRFLEGFLQQVFDTCTGRLLDEPSIVAISAIRQFCMAFAKVAVPCSPERVSKAFDGYVKCEMDIRRADEAWRPRFGELRKVAQAVFGELLDKVDLSVDRLELRPKHGPGATADSLKGNQKYSGMHWTSRLEEFFPAARYLIPNPRYCQVLESVDFHEPRDEIPVKVITVPKTLKSPRIIAVEPTCMQYAQQALMREFVERIEGDDILSSFIGFTDQVPNQDLAREGSLTGELATLDLSEASDRVSNQHVEALMFWKRPTWGALQASRSTKADVPGYGVIPLSKFASMGSAVCFPIEAMVFFTIIMASISRQLRRPVTKQLLLELRGRVRVYGDDIIVPVGFAPGVVEDLHSFGMKVNSHKSFWTGKFRESCGGDFYDGHRITPVRVRSVLPASPQHASEIVSTVSLRNQLFDAGYEKSVKWLDKWIRGVLPVFPEVLPSTSVLGRHTHEPVLGSRVCRSTHRPLVRGYRVVAKAPVSNLDDHGALMKFFLHEGKEPLSEDSFLRAGRPRSVNIKIGWSPL